ncbi:alpha/beta fold hydrolase [Kitasatospora sp. NPDC093550]|uniref:alpha/beta fold hydrolase n=1 Tax=Kitasatospora sp. NPDC093550 TaxID=3364089 RepID=UPI003811ABA0
MQGNGGQVQTGSGLRSVQDAIVRAFAECTPGGVSPGELDRDGRALRWVEAGRGSGAPVILIAGSGTSSLTWTPVLPELARHGRVVAYDRAGLGASEPHRAPAHAATAHAAGTRATPAHANSAHAASAHDAGAATGRVAPPSLEDQLADLAALVRYLDAGPAVLVGHSWGGQLAQLLAWQRPELVAGLVLVDPAHEEFQPPSVRVAGAALNRLWLLRTALAGSVPGSGDPLARAEAAVIAHHHQRWTVLAENRLTAVVVPELRRRRAAAHLPPVPVAVLSATEGLPRAMRSRWTALQSQVASRAVRGTHMLVRGAGHAVHTDRPRAVIAAVLEVSDHARYLREN